ncbi:MAG: NAD(P)-binding domain-containing protein [Acidimicrobiales bacterium]
MDIGIIGAGSVGRSLGRGLAAAGHTVVFGVRDVGDTRHADLAAAGQLADPAGAVADAQVVVLAVPADAVTTAIAAMPLRAGQVLADATNAVRTPVPDGHDTLGSYVASLLPAGVAFVKAFDTIGAEHFDGRLVGTSGTFLPIAGDSDGVDVIARLAVDLGFEPAVLGGRESVRLVEDHARLWIHLAFAAGWGRGFRFAVVREP